MPFKALFASPAGHLSGATFCHPRTCDGEAHKGRAQPMHRQERQALRRRATWNMQTREKEGKDWISQGTMIGIQTSGRRARKHSEYERGGGWRHRLCDTKVINAAVQSEVVSVDCAPNEGGLLGFQMWNPAEPPWKCPISVVFTTKPSAAGPISLHLEDIGSSYVQVLAATNTESWRKLEQVWFEQGSSTHLQFLVAPFRNILWT